MSTHFRRSKDANLSKTLTWLLRHAAQREGLEISEDGYVSINAILNHKSLKNKYTLDDVCRVVEENDKKRFTFWRHPETNDLKIKANQGHSIKVISDSSLELISDASQAPVVVHGTYRSCWENIKHEGLSRMNRLHVHFAPGKPGAADVISGIRNDCDTFIYIDIAQALKDGLKFYRSVNNVILSPGNEQGFIDPKYFSKVEDRGGHVIY